MISSSGSSSGSSSLLLLMMLLLLLEKVKKKKLWNCEGVESRKSYSYKEKKKGSDTEKRMRLDLFTMANTR